MKRFLWWSARCRVHNADLPGMRDLCTTHNCSQVSATMLPLLIRTVLYISTKIEGSANTHIHTQTLIIFFLLFFNPANMRTFESPITVLRRHYSTHNQLKSIVNSGCFRIRVGPLHEHLNWFICHSCGEDLQMLADNGNFNNSWMAVCSVVKGIMKEDIALGLVNYAGGGEGGGWATRVLQCCCSLWKVRRYDRKDSLPYSKLRKKNTNDCQ